MNPLPFQTLATGFTVVGAFLGLPSAAFLVFFAICTLWNRLSSAPARPSSLGNNPDAILTLLQWMTEGVTALARGLGALGQLVLNGLAVAACAALLAGLACWFTGRGLQVNATWARVTGSVLLGCAVVPSLLLALTFNNLARLLPLTIVVVCFLGLHTLWSGASAPGN